MKRADLSTRLVLTAVSAHFPCAWEVLTETYPPKLVLAAFMREVDAGRLDYGVAAHRPFLTDAGHARLIAERWSSGTDLTDHPASTERSANG